MIEPLKISRNEFPKSDKTSEGMIPLKPTQDNYCMGYVRDLVYVMRGNQPLYIQLILPDYEGYPVPLIIYVTGSAFHKQDVINTVPRLSVWANRGYAVASVEYRGSEVAPFPAQFLDAKVAIRFLKSKAEEYHFDVNRIFLLGDSSGGHTVLMAGVTAGMQDFEEDIYSEFTSNVSGIIDMYGPTDITVMNEEPSTQNHIIPDSPEGYLIGHYDVSMHPHLSQPTIVMNYISKDRKIPPVLIFHGTNDELVPFGQSCMLYDKLIECGKEASFYALEGSHHGGREFWSTEVAAIIEKFMNHCS